MCVRLLSRILLAFGIFWLAFVVLSHAGEPLTAGIEGLVVASPFVAGAILCRRWPRTIGLLLLAASVWSIVFFQMIPRSGSNAEELMRHAFTLLLIPLPLTISGVALATARSATNEDAATGRG